MVWPEFGVTMAGSEQTFENVIDGVVMPTSSEQSYQVCCVGSSSPLVPSSVDDLDEEEDATAEDSRSVKESDTQKIQKETL